MRPLHQKVRPRRGKEKNESKNKRKKASLVQIGKKNATKKFNGANKERKLAMRGKKRGRRSIMGTVIELRFVLYHFLLIFVGR